MKSRRTANIKLRDSEGRREVFDIVRNRFVALTPEEWVRQHVIHYLHEELGYPLELMQVEGVGEHTSLFLGLFSDLMDSYITDRRQNEIISGIENITAFALRKLSYAPVESLLVFFFDNKQFLLSWHCLQEGSVTPEEIDIRTMVHMVMGTNATYVMMARNNPKGMAKLIKKDNAIALTVSEAMRSIGVLLYDYIVVSRDRSYVTMLGNAYTAPTNDASAERVGDPS